jgi:hypothetical protein
MSAAGCPSLRQNSLAAVMEYGAVRCAFWSPSLGIFKEMNKISRIYWSKVTVFEQAAALQKLCQCAHSRQLPPTVKLRLSLSLQHC